MEPIPNQEPTPSNNEPGAAAPTPPPAQNEGRTLPPPGGPSLPPSSSAPLPLSLPSTKEDRTWAIFIHLSGILGACFTYCMIPGHILAPLILWLVKRQDSPFLDDHGKECVNFQITLTLATLPCLVLLLVCIGFPMLVGLAIYAVVIQVMAAIKASDGLLFRYPYILRFIK